MPWTAWSSPQTPDNFEEHRVPVGPKWLGSFLLVRFLLRKENEQYQTNIIGVLAS